MDPKDYHDVTNTNMRRIIAKRLTESKTKVPHAYVYVECGGSWWWNSDMVVS